MLVKFKTSENKYFERFTAIVISLAHNETPDEYIFGKNYLKKYFDVDNSLNKWTDYNCILVFIDSDKRGASLCNDTGQFNQYVDRGQLEKVFSYGDFRNDFLGKIFNKSLYFYKSYKFDYSI
jgi:hypothetical protein